MKTLGLILITLSTFANPLDIELSEYIEKFNYGVVKKSSEKNEPLYELGRQLFFSTKLSLAGDISCAHCHHPTRGTGDDLPLAIGTGFDGDITSRVQGHAGVTTRNSPALWNRGGKDMKSLFWDGRVAFNKKDNYVMTPADEISGKDPVLKEVASLLTSAIAAQSLFPPTSTVEMKGPRLEGESVDKIWNEILEQILDEHNLRVFFTLAYPGVEKLNIGHVAKAIGHFEEVEFHVDDTSWDDYLRGNKEALSEAEKRGAILFSNKAKCSNCHNGATLSNQEFNNILIADIGMDEVPNDMGRFDVTGKDKDKYSFRTPELRNVVLTGPFMHNGLFDDLAQVVVHYDHPMRTLMHFTPDRMNEKYGKFYNGKFVREWSREKVRAIFETKAKGLEMNLRLNKEEANDLLCFLEKSLTSKKYQKDCRIVFK